MKQKWTRQNRKSDFFKNEVLNQKSGTVKPLDYVLTIFHDCGDPEDVKLAMPPASNSAHEIHGFHSPSELLELQSSFSSPKIDFWKCLSNVPYVQIWLLMTFWMSQSDRECISDHLQALGTIWRKTHFSNFLTFLKQFLLHFSLKMKQKWIWKNRKSDFFKNEALNQKSETVKPLGYVLTVFHDCGDPPDLILAMPPASNSAHENRVFKSFWELQIEDFLKSRRFLPKNT